MSNVGCAPGDPDSRHGETLSYLIPSLPEDIWCHIYSLMPMRDSARAACLSRAFLRSWRCHPNLTLTGNTSPEGMCRRDLLEYRQCSEKPLGHWLEDIGAQFRLQAIECKAPNLSIINLSGERIKLSLGQLLKMKKLYMRHPDVVCYAHVDLPSIMPNLDTLEIVSGIEVFNAPMLLTKFLYLKHLTIQIWDRTFSPPYDYFSLVCFFDVSPSLETFFFDVPQEDVKQESVFGASSHLRQLPEYQHSCLRIVEIIGFSSAKSLVELTCCIAKNAVSLERLTLDTLRDSERCSGEANKTCWPISNAVLKEASRAVMAIRMYIEDKVAPTAKLTVLEPCTRCHSC